MKGEYEKKMKQTRKKVLGLILASVLLFVLAACGSEEGNGAGDSEGNTDKPLQVVTSFTIIEDMAKEIGGDNVEVHNLVPTGTDPHEYEPLPEDIKKASDADILFYNGMNLEGGSNGWFMKMIDSVNQDEDKVFSLTERVEPMYVGKDQKGVEEEVNPHTFIDPVVGIYMAEDMRDALIEIDPDNAEEYSERAEAYLEVLKEIDKKYEEKINEIPEEKRILVTSEQAFQYMTNRYGLEEAYIWAVDTEENGTPQQITSLVDYLKKNDVRTLFVESNVDTRPMETVSNETGIPIYEKPIYSDEIGEKGSEADTYVKYLEYNIEVISDGLSE